MKRTLITLAGISLIIGIILLPSCSDKTNNKDKKKVALNGGTSMKLNDNINPDKKTLQPQWLDTIPLVVAGGWDSEPATQRRWGRLSVDYMDEYKKRISEDNVIKLKENGITLIITHYFKGYGFEGEGTYMENTKKFAELCHKHGLRVGVYIGNTICYEQLLLEEPKAEDWLVPDFMGRPVTYGGTQTFRRKPYIGHPGYQEYIKRVLKKAILDAKVDLIHFDNTSQYGMPENFHHPLAIEQFRDFLRNKYTPDQLEDRFDFRDVSYVVPPKYSGTPQPIQDPLFQEWTDFRCWKVNEYLNELYHHIKELNSEVVVEGNHQGDNGENFMWVRGRDLARMLPNSEASWSELEKDPGIMENGSLASRIRSLKTARIFDNKLFFHSGHDRLKMAEALAYNQNCLGYIGALLSHNYWDEETKQYVRFFHDHFPYYRNTENVAPVAILRTFPTMAYSPHDTRYSTYLFEQTLIQTKIPFDIIFDQHLEEDISKYKVLVLANQDCMSDEQIEKVRSFVEAGGGLVITENTSLYNEWRRRRHSLGLRDLFKEDLPYPPGTKISQHPWSLDSKWYRHSSWVRELEGFTEEKIDQVRGEYGKGRVVYFPHVKPGLNKPSGSAPTSNYWKLPDNYKQLEEAVRWTAENAMSLQINAPLYVTAEWVLQQETNRMIVHLVNYGVKTKPMVNDIGIRMKITEGKEVKDVSLFSPDTQVKSKKLSYQTDNGWLNVAVPGLHIYNMVAVQYE